MRGRATAVALPALAVLGARRRRRGRVDGVGSAEDRARRGRRRTRCSTRSSPSDLSRWSPEDAARVRAHAAQGDRQADGLGTVSPLVRSGLPGDHRPCDSRTIRAEPVDTGRPGAADESIFGGARPGSPTTPGDDDHAVRAECELASDRRGVALVAVALVAYVVSDDEDGARRDPRAELARNLADALDDALDDLRAEADPRRAVIAAYARLERILAANGVARDPSETPESISARARRPRADVRARSAA